MWYNNGDHICVIGVPEEGREKEAERIFREIMTQTFQIWWKTWICTSKKLNEPQAG